MGEPWYERAADFALSLVAPTRAAVRRHWKKLGRDSDYREAYELALRMRGYKAAASGKNSTPFLGASSKSADAEILNDLPTLRNRSRLLNRDDAVASGITQTFTRGVVGTGLRPQARTGDDAKDDALEAVWRTRCDRLALGDGGLSHGQAQKLRYGKRHEDGEILLRPAVSYPGEPVWIENIEAERLCTPRDASPLDPKGRIVDGVEKDRWGRVVAYWILNEHPGETGAATKFGAAASTKSPFSANSFTRVEESSVRHDRNRITRPGQTRGVPTCHAILQDLRDLDLLITASLKRTQIAACLAVFLTSDASAADLIELTAEEYGYQLDQKIEPGMIFRLNPGEKAEFLNPSSGLVDITAFAFFFARRIGSAVGLSPQAVLKNWDGISYSAARTIKIDDRLTFWGERADFANTLTWEWRIVHEDELMRGNPLLLQAGVTLEDLYLVEWIGDEEKWVDPQAEAAATEIMLRLGITTYQIECARAGRDWKENLKARQAVQAECERLGIAEPGVEPGATQAVSRPGVSLSVVKGNGAQDGQEAAA